MWGDNLKEFVTAAVDGGFAPKGKTITKYAFGENGHFDFRLEGEEPSYQTHVGLMLWEPTAWRCAGRIFGWSDSEKFKRLDEKELKDKLGFNSLEELGEMLIRDHHDELGIKNPEEMTVSVYPQNMLDGVPDYFWLEDTWQHKMFSFFRYAMDSENEERVDDIMHKVLHE